MFSQPMRLDAEDNRVDFSNANLYLSGIQTVFAICVCACVSVLSCWLVPTGSVSAVRTLALCSFFGAVLIHKPLRIGRVGRAHGVTVVFDSLQPSVPLYLSTLVIEQLIHTCTSDDVAAPSWRRVIFHTMQLVLVCAGFLRARRPMADTDLPFVLTVLTLLILAMLPPPAIAFVGPLCQSVGLWEAAERFVRAFTFAVLYAINVYSITSSNGIYISETQVVVTRSAAASLWVMGCHFYWLPLAIAQCTLAIYARVCHNESGGGDEASKSHTKCSEYATLDAANSTDDEGELDMECGGSGMLHALSDPVAEQRRLLAEPQLYTPVAAPIGAHDVEGEEPIDCASCAALSSMSLQTMLAAVASPGIPSGVRPQTPSDDVPRFGPRSFQNVNEQPPVIPSEGATVASSESNFRDRAAEIAQRIA
tara:strand:- start:1223 stop:2485 length:1263 start_codon:yes stop_codon:yes gene_type:complete